MLWRDQSLRNTLLLRDHSLRNTLMIRIPAWRIIVALRRGRCNIFRSSWCSKALNTAPSSRYLRPWCIPSLIIRIVHASTQDPVCMKGVLSPKLKLIQNNLVPGIWREVKRTRPKKFLLHPSLSSLASCFSTFSFAPTNQKFQMYH